jgi:hypothetical protein
VVRLRTRGQRTKIYSTVTPSFETSHRNFYKGMAGDDYRLGCSATIRLCRALCYIAVGYRWSRMRSWSHVERFWCEHKRDHGALLKRCLTQVRANKAQSHRVASQKASSVLSKVVLTGSGSLLSLRMKAIEPQHRRPSATTRCCLSYRIVSSRTAVIAMAFPAALWVSLDGLHCCLTPASGPPCPYSCVRGVP